MTSGPRVREPEHDRLTDDRRPDAHHPRRPAHQRAAVDELLHHAVGDREHERRHERADARARRTRRRRTAGPGTVRRAARAARRRRTRATAQRIQRRAGQRRYSDAGVAWSTRATIASADQDDDGLDRPPGRDGRRRVRAVAEPSAAATGPSVPQNRLTATGTAPAHVQRTGASRETAIAVPDREERAGPRSQRRRHRGRDREQRDRDDRAQEVGRIGRQELRRRSAAHRVRRCCR